MKIKKSLQELNLLDRFLFAEATEDKEFLETVLAIILEKDIELKHPPQTEKEFRNALEKKDIRVDVWDEDIDGDVYDVEPQARNTGNLPKRSRYYQGLMDVKLLPEGTVDYNLLNDIYIILIAPFDLFGKGRYRYTYSMACEEEEGLRLRDGARRIFLNTRGNDAGNVSEELAALLRYMETTTEEVAEASGSERIRGMHRKVTAIKANKEVGVKYMNAYEEKMLERQEGFEEGISQGIQQGIRQGISQGIQQGIRQGIGQRNREIAVNMLRKGMDKGLVMEVTGWSMEEIDELEAELRES